MVYNSYHVLGMRLFGVCLSSLGSHLELLKRVSLIFTLEKVPRLDLNPQNDNTDGDLVIQYLHYPRIPRRAFIQAFIITQRTRTLG